MIVNRYYHWKRAAVNGLGLLAVLVISFGTAWTILPSSSKAEDIKVFKNSGCQCCARWAAQLRAKGHHVTEKGVLNMDAIKKMYNVPEKFEGCHTALVGGYVIEGHVPLREIERLLRERPDAKGLAVAGMPMGSPGMEVPGEKPDSYDVLLLKKDGTSEVYAKY